jgi:hypothetical protein
MITVSAETEQLARRLAEKSGKTPEQVVGDAVASEARLAGVALDAAIGRRSVDLDLDLDRVREIVARIAAKPLGDPRTPQAMRIAHLRIEYDR